MDGVETEIIDQMLLGANIDVRVFEDAQQGRAYLGEDGIPMCRYGHGANVTSR
jgi:hypothetical protein